MLIIMYVIQLGLFCLIALFMLSAYLYDAYNVRSNRQDKLAVSTV